MVNVYEVAYNALFASGYPVFQENTTPGADALPATYLTYMVIIDEPLAHANNRPVGVYARVMVKVYSKDPAVTQNGKQLLDGLMSGWIQLPGFDLPYDKETGHYGYTRDYRYFEF